MGARAAGAVAGFGAGAGGATVRRRLSGGGGGSLIAQLLHHSSLRQRSCRWSAAIPSGKLGRLSVGQIRTRNPFKATAALMFVSSGGCAALNLTCRRLTRSP